MVDAMNIFSNTVNGIISLLGLTTTVAGFIYIGRKLQILDELKKTVDVIKHNLKVVTDFLIKKFPDFNHEDLRNYSPVQLSEHGKGFITSIGFDAVFVENKKDFFGVIDDDLPKMKYDVQTSAIKSIYSLSDNAYMDRVKTYLYEHPDRKMDRVASTLGIYVRDAYLAEHPEIN